jgi:hypothetical protein
VGHGGQRDWHGHLRRRRPDVDQAVHLRWELHQQDDQLLRRLLLSPSQRTGPDACPLTTLYWDFLLRHDGALAKVNRIAPQRRAAQARPDRNSIQEWAPNAVAVIVSGRRREVAETFDQTGVSPRSVTR